MTPEEKLDQMGLEIPEVPEPVASYVPGVRTGNLLLTSGQIPVADGNLKYEGKVGEDLTEDEGYEAARLCCLNCLGVLKDQLGDLSKVKRVVKLNGFVNSSADFTGQSQVVNGASDLLAEVFGEPGAHARAAVGMVNLPLGAAVEVELIVEVE